MLKSHRQAKLNQMYLICSYIHTQWTKGEQRITCKTQILFYGTHKVAFSSINASNKLPRGITITVLSASRKKYYGGLTVYYFK